VMKTQTFAEYARKGGFYRVHTADVGKSDSTETDAKNLLRLIQQTANELKASPMSAMPKYNAMSWVTPWRDSEAILFATPQVIAALNVEALAAAFNIDRANVPYRIIPIPEDLFGIGGDGGKVQAVLTTEDFFFCWDEMLETTNSPVNPIDGTRNIFLKHRGSITPNPFANAVLFWTGAGSGEDITLPDTLTTSKPEFEIRLKKYGQSAVTPQDVSRGDLVQVVATIKSANAETATFQPVGIKYTIEGATSQFTSVDNEGIIRCGLDETADSIKVTAQATYINPATPEIDQTVSTATGNRPDGIHRTGCARGRHLGRRFQVGCARKAHHHRPRNRESERKHPAQGHRRENGRHRTGCDQPRRMDFGRESHGSPERHRDRQGGKR